MQPKSLHKTEMIAEEVAFWASSVDSFLQEYKVSMSEPIDPQKAAIACVKLAQIGFLMFQNFKEGAVTLVDKAEDKRAALFASQDACKKVAEMVDKRLDTLYKQTETLVAEDEQRKQNRAKMLN